MSTLDPEDGSLSPSSSSETDESDMTTDQKADPRPGEKSSEKKANGSKANAKDPTRPRRKKARRACLACQRAHLTCSDERPCERCIKRGVGDHCADGVRKKAKYLYDAPDNSLMSGLGEHYAQMNGLRSVPFPSPGQRAVAMGQQGVYLAQGPPASYYTPSAVQAQPMPAQNAAFSTPQGPMSPPYGPHPQPGMPTAMAPASQPAYATPLFDPSDPAFFNFDISSLNFGNHYGALEMGMLGHMSSSALDAAHDNPLDQAAHAYNGLVGPRAYAEGRGLPSHGPMPQEGFPTVDWQQERSRNGSFHVHTPNNTPNMDQSGALHDGVHGPLAYAIGQGPSSLSSASPASTDFNSGYENDNPMSTAAFFANANQTRRRASPTAHRQQYSTYSNGRPPYLVESIPKRQSKSIYDSVKSPYDYATAYHRLVLLSKQRFSHSSQNKISNALGRLRPALLSNAASLDSDDLIHMEKTLQRSLIMLHDISVQVGTPCLILRRSGEVVGMNKEFEILTGWRRDVLLGRSPNLNVNVGTSQRRAGDHARQVDTTPVLPDQEQDVGPFPVTVFELFDEPSVVQYLDDFADLSLQEPLGTRKRRVNLLQYTTKEDMARIAESTGNANGKPLKNEPLIKHEDGSIHHGEALRNIGANGLVDAMIMWHIKRDTFDMPMLIDMRVLPILKA